MGLSSDLLYLVSDIHSLCVRILHAHIPNTHVCMCLYTWTCMSMPKHTNVHAHACIHCCDKWRYKHAYVIHCAHRYLRTSLHYTINLICI